MPRLISIPLLGVTPDRVGNESNIFTGSEPRPSFSEIDRSRVVIIEGKTRDIG